MHLLESSRTDRCYRPSCPRRAAGLRDGRSASSRTADMWATPGDVPPTRGQRTLWGALWGVQLNGDRDLAAGIASGDGTACVVDPVKLQ